MHQKSFSFKTEKENLEGNLPSIKFHQILHHLSRSFYFNYYCCCCYYVFLSTKKGKKTFFSLKNTNFALCFCVKHWKSSGNTPSTQTLLLLTQLLCNLFLFVIKKSLWGFMLFTLWENFSLCDFEKKCFLLGKLVVWTKGLRFTWIWIHLNDEWMKGCDEFRQNKV